MMPFQYPVSECTYARSEKIEQRAGQYPISGNQNHSIENPMCKRAFRCKVIAWIEMVAYYSRQQYNQQMLDVAHPIVKNGYFESLRIKKVRNRLVMLPIKIPGSPQKCPAMMATVRLMITSAMGAQVS